MSEIEGLILIICSSLNRLVNFSILPSHFSGWLLVYKLHYEGQQMILVGYSKIQLCHLWKTGQRDLCNCLEE